MKIYIRLLCLIVCFTLGIGSIWGGSTTKQYTSRVTVKVDPNNTEAGSVAIKHAISKRSGTNTTHTKDGDDPKYPEDYGLVKEDSYTSDGGNTAAEQRYYVYAEPAPGYEFDHWEGGPTGNPINNSTKKDDIFQFSNSTQGGTLPYTLTAYFRAIGIIERETNNNAGNIKFDSDDVVFGETITATATLKEVGDGNINMMTYFSHWEDGEGNFLSDDNPYSFTAQPMTLRAIFETKAEAPKVGKYYRVRNAYNRVLSIAGNFSWSPTLTNADVPTALLRWAKPLEFEEENFKGSWPISDEFEPLCPEASPSTIIYIEEGKENENGITQAVLSSQGINTEEMTGMTLDVVPIFDNFYGYYGIEATSMGNTVAFQVVDRSGEGKVNVTAPKYSQPYCAMAIQPIDEDHIDDYWFGALADEDMLFDGGYWTSMYTSFPYMIYDEGIEVYYITSDTKMKDGTTYVYLTKVEDGIIPKESAVLIKCTEPNNTKANRMLPLVPSQVEKTSLEGNILKGTYQLYTKSSREGREKFDESKMRVFGVNPAGVVGFYKLPVEQELLPNKVYLDLNKISAEVSTSSFKLAKKEDVTTAIESFEEDANGIENGLIYDLYGRQIRYPQPGSIYIINGKKIIWK